jgi:type VI secretion system protein ImpM
METIGAAPLVFGKLPARGDFITRRASAAFLRAWDSWLQQVMIAVRERIGAAWLDAYLAAPIWRFFLSAGLCGEDSVTGIMMPSVDQVGRYFPLTLGSRVENGVSAGPFVAANAAWYAALEERALAALDDDFMLERFDQPAPLASAAPGSGTSGAGSPSSQPAVRYGLDRLDSVPTRLAVESPGFSAWWTDGSTEIQRSLLIANGLPDPAAAVALFDGAWNRHGWDEGALPAPQNDGRGELDWLL